MQMLLEKNLNQIIIIMDDLILFKLDKEDKDTLKQMAQKEKLSLSSYIRNKLLVDEEPEKSDIQISLTPNQFRLVRTLIHNHLSIHRIDSSASVIKQLESISFKFKNANE